MSLRMQPQGQVESAVKIKILRQGGNHTRSMEILARNDLRPLTHREALARAPELIEKLKGTWFYLDGKGTFGDGIYTFNARGDLVQPNGNEKYDQKVRVYSGNRSLALFVYPGTYYDWRFGLFGDLKPSNVAPVVVGIDIKPEAKEAVRG